MTPIAASALPIDLLLLSVLLLAWLALRRTPRHPVKLAAGGPTSAGGGQLPSPDWLAAVANRSGGTNQGAKQASDHERRVAEALIQLAVELPRHSDLDVSIHRSLTLVADYLGADDGLIFLTDAGSERLQVRSRLSNNVHPEPTPEQVRQSTRELAHWVIDNNLPKITDRTGEAASSEIAVPLIIDQDTLGVLVFTSDEPAAFHESQLPVVTAAASQLSAAIYHAELYRLIRDQASRQGGMIREKRMEASKTEAIFESTAEGLLFTDAENEIALFNAAAERILGLSRDQVLGQPASDFIGVYGEAGEQWLRAVRRWSREPHSIDQTDGPLEARLTLEDDRIVALTVAPVMFDRNFIGTVTTFRDITREVEVDRLKSEFVATVSHELRTPMTSVKGYVEMLLMQAVGEINDEQRHFLKVIKGNIDRLGSLVNDLLDISRIEAGRVRLSLERVDLADLLRETSEAFLRRARLESKPMHFELELSDDLPTIEADRNRLRQIINNLVENSFNYTPADGTIWLAARPKGQEVEISIRDNGIGITPAEQERIFERFFRGEQALNLSVAGTGLGLSIVSQLVEMHHGRIALQSEGAAGKGTTFTITLPADFKGDQPEETI